MQINMLDQDTGLDEFFEEIVEEVLKQFEFDEQVFEEVTVHKL